MKNKTPQSSKRTVCMLVANDVVNDPRVARHAETLGVHGFRVVVVCPLSKRTGTHEDRKTYEILRARDSRCETALRLIGREQGSSSNGYSQVSGLGLTRLISGIGSFFLTQLALLRTARMQAAHIFCANDFDSLFVAILAAGLDRPVVYDSHELWPDMMLIPNRIKTMACAIEKLLIKQTDLVMAPNEFVAKELASRFSLQTFPQVVYNCSSLESHVKRKRRTGDLKIALFQGKYNPDRGLENLIRAADHLLPDVCLVLRGFGPNESTLRSLAVGRRNVQFAEPVSMNELVRAAADADVGIITYPRTNLNNYFACPNKLFEYAQAGLPVVASDTPLMRKIILENDIGSLFAADDPKSIADAINKSTRDEMLRRLRANLPAFATKYSWQVESKKLLDAYASLG